MFGLPTAVLAGVAESLTYLTEQPDSLASSSQGVAVVRVERVRTNKVPYRPEPEVDDLPEFDFEITEYTVPENGIMHLPKKGKVHK